MRRHQIWLLLISLLAVALLLVSCTVGGNEKDDEGTGEAVTAPETGSSNLADDDPTATGDETGVHLTEPDTGGEPDTGDNGSAADVAAAAPAILCEPGEPTMISTIEELQALAETAGSEDKLGDGYYALANDIEAAATRTWNDGAGFEPIGDLWDPFTGCFDGGGHTIEGLHINRPETSRAGLFGAVADSDVRNIKLENVTVTGAFETGALAGRSIDTAVLAVHTTGEVRGASNVGGLLGENVGGTVTSSSSSADVSSSRPDGQGEALAAGGLVGRNDLGGEILDSHSSGHVTGGAEVGGLVGYNDLGTGTLIATSYSTGSARGERLVGGLVGRNRSFIENSYSLASAEAANFGAGGLVGGNEGGTISYSYSIGTAQAASEAGGLAGKGIAQINAEQVISSYWNTES